MDNDKRRFAPTRQYCVHWTMLCTFIVWLVSTRSFAADFQIILNPLPDQSLISNSTQNRGFTANGDSRNPTVNLDGRFLAFESRASDMGLLERGGAPFEKFQIYLLEFSRTRDPEVPAELLPQLFLPVTFNERSGEAGNGDSVDPSLAPEGFAVAFSSTATNLNPQGAIDVDGRSDVYVFDKNSGMRLVSVSAFNPGRSGIGESDQPSFGGNGIVAFRTNSPDVGRPVLDESVPLDYLLIAWANLNRFDGPGAPPEMFKIVPDVALPPNGDSRAPHVSDDGTKIVFETDATNFPTVPPLLNDPAVSGPFIVLYDLQTQEFQQVSLSSTGSPLEFARHPKIGMGGTHVAFTGKDEGSLTYQVFLRDLENQTTRIVTIGRQGPVRGVHNVLNDFSGPFLVFTSDGSMSPLDTQNPQLPDVYLHNIEKGSTILASVSPRTRLAGGVSSSRKHAEVTSDGECVAFFSTSPGLLPVGIQKSKDPQTGENNEDVHVFRPFRFPVEFSGPSNHLLLGMDRVGLAQVDLKGNLTETVFAGVGAFSAVTVDELNVAWVLAGDSVLRFQALSGSRIGSPWSLDGPSGFTHLVATAGSCWIASHDRILKLRSHRFGPLETSAEVTYDPVGEVSLALDSGKSLWALFRAETGNRILHMKKYDRDTLSLLDEVRLDIPRDNIAPDEYFNLIDIDENGDVLVRSQNLLCRFLSRGDLVWKHRVNGGDGLVVDGDGNAFVVTRVSGDQTQNQLMGFSPRGHIFFTRLLADTPANAPSTDLIVDGESGIWVLFGGSSTVVRVDPVGLTRTIVFQNDPDGNAPLILDQHNSNGTGFRTANVVQPEVDSDADGFANKEEIRRKNNPFDAQPPDDGERLPPVEELEGAYEANADVVDMTWRAPVEYCEYVVFRNNRIVFKGPIQTGCNGEPAFVCFQDDNPPAGVLHYRIVGGCPEDFKDDGGAAGVRRKEEDPAPAFDESSFSSGTELTVFVGSEGAVKDDLDFDDLGLGTSDLHALATYEDGGTTKVLVAYSGSLAPTVDNQLAIFSLDGDTLVKDAVSDDIVTGLPASGEFGESSIAGLHVDSASKVTHVIFENGYMVNFDLDDLTGDAVLDAEDVQSLGNVHPVSADEPLGSYLSSGLEQVNGRFFSLLCPTLANNISGPGIDCIIGIAIAEDAASRVEDRSLSGPTGVLGHRVLDRAAGLALLDSDSLLVSVRSGETPYEDVVEIDVTVPDGDGATTFSAGTTSISLEGMPGLAPIVSGVAYVSASDRLIVLDSNQSVLAVLEASFPQRSTVSLDPPRGHWDDSTEVTITVDFGLAINKPANVAALEDGDFGNCLRCDGNEVSFSVDSFSEEGVAVLKFTTQDRDIGDPDPPVRVIALAIHTLDGISTADFSAGFIRGDSDENDIVDIVDVIQLLFCQWGGHTCNCADEVDVDDSGSVDITDPLVLLKHLFLGTVSPGWPYPAHDQDRTEDGLDNCGDVGSEYGG